MAAMKNPEALGRCRNCGAEYHFGTPTRCHLCGTPMLRVISEPEPERTQTVRHVVRFDLDDDDYAAPAKTVRHLQVVKGDAS